MMKAILHYLLNRLEDFFAAITFKIIEAKDKWGMKE